MRRARDSTSCACASDTPACAGRWRVSQRACARTPSCREEAPGRVRRQRGGARGGWEGGAAPSQGVALIRLGGTSPLCEERGRLSAAGRLVAAPVRRFRGVRQQVHRVRARESLEPWRKRERESSSLSCVSVSWCGVCPRPYGPAHGRCGVCPRPYGPAHGWVLPASTGPRKSSSKYARALRANAL